ncbi:MAG: hypothetical protein V4666_08065 [Bacteroidota bacterium]
MNRKNFLRSIVTGLGVVAVSPLLLANEVKITGEYNFDELFIVHKGNERLIYPKKESLIYKFLEKSFIDRVDSKKHHTYLPVHHLSIPVKERYKAEDFLPIKFYFESVYGKMNKYTFEQHDVIFRLIKDAPDRMHLEVFLA